MLLRSTLCCRCLVLRPVLVLVTRRARLVRLPHRLMQACTRLVPCLLLVRVPVVPLSVLMALLMSLAMLLQARLRFGMLVPSRLTTVPTLAQSVAARAPREVSLLSCRARVSALSLRLPTSEAESPQVLTIPPRSLIRLLYLVINLPMARWPVLNLLPSRLSRQCRSPVVLEPLLHRL